MSKRKLNTYLFILLYWIFVVNFFGSFSILIVRGFMRYEGITPESLTHKIAIYWISPSQYIEAVLGGIFLGLLFIFINELSNRFHWDRLGFGRLIVLKSIAYSVGFSIVFFVIYSIIDALGYYPDDLLTSFTFSREITIIFVMVLFFMTFQIVLLNYIIETNRKIGDFNLISFLTGKYREPVLEDRLFMFIDLRSSTSIAEKLDDVQYSQFLRDCFRDFNLSLKANESLDIYQYVGDEVVVTSKWERERDLINMTTLYFRFAQRLEKRSKHYESAFGIVPFFKAGIHGGRVSVAEIGTLRRDIAFHGDVMNTASRIQSLCNELRQGLLVSSTVLSKNDQLGKYKTKDMGTFQLKGKEDAVGVLAILPSE